MGKNNSKRKKYTCPIKYMENVHAYLEPKKLKVKKKGRHYFTATKLAKVTELKIPMWAMVQGCEHFHALQMKRYTEH